MTITSRLFQSFPPPLVSLLPFSSVSPAQQILIKVSPREKLETSIRTSSSDGWMPSLDRQEETLQTITFICSNTSEVAHHQVFDVGTKKTRQKKKQWKGRMSWHMAYMTLWQAIIHFKQFLKKIEEYSQRKNLQHKCTWGSEQTINPHPKKREGKAGENMIKTRTCGIWGCALWLDHLARLLPWLGNIPPPAYMCVLLHMLFYIVKLWHSSCISTFHSFSTW